MVKVSVLIFGGLTATAVLSNVANTPTNQTDKTASVLQMPFAHQAQQVAAAAADVWPSDPYIVQRASAAPETTFAASPDPFGKQRTVDAEGAGADLQ